MVCTYFDSEKSSHISLEISMFHSVVHEYFHTYEKCLTYYCFCMFRVFVCNFALLISIVLLIVDCVVKCIASFEPLLCLKCLFSIVENETATMDVYILVFILTM